jgi:hypothetical protein
MPVYPLIVQWDLDGIVVVVLEYNCEWLDHVGNGSEV